MEPGAKDTVRTDVAWEVAPLRAAALRTERAYDQRWQSLRAAISGGALLLGVIGAAAAISMTLGPSLPGGMGFLSGESQFTAGAVTPSPTRDGVATPTPSADEEAGADRDSASRGDEAPAAAVPAGGPEPVRATPTSEPTPEPEPSIAPTPAPSTAPPTETPTPAPTTESVEPSSDATTGQAPTAEEADGLIESILDLLLPGLLP